MKIVKSVSVKKESILNSASVNGGCLANILISFSVKGGSLAIVFWSLFQWMGGGGGSLANFSAAGEPGKYSETVIEAGSGWWTLFFIEEWEPS